MKIGIVTVYNSYNCGSFLQATSLYKFLEEKGHNVCFIKRPTNKEHCLYHRILMSVKYALKKQKLKSKHILSTYFSYKDQLKSFLIEDFNDSIDLYIYGSDTIWNIHDKYFKSEWKRFWGYEIPKRKVAYAPSVGNTLPQEVSDIPELVNCLLSFSAISVRDKQTMDVVNTLTQKDMDIVQVLDPTMLLDTSYYNKMASQCNESNFVLVYAFSDLSLDAVNSIRSFAQKNKKKIIAFGDNFPADVNIPFEPSVMLGYYNKADYVFTNTFHGTVFSIIYNKNFASYGRKKIKVTQILDDFGLSQRNVDCNSNLHDVMSSNIDYHVIKQIIAEKRKLSIDYLNSQIG